MKSFLDFRWKYNVITTHSHEICYLYLFRIWIHALYFIFLCLIIYLVNRIITKMLSKKYKIHFQFSVTSEFYILVYMFHWPNPIEQVNSYLVLFCNNRAYTWYIEYSSMFFPFSENCSLVDLAGKQQKVSVHLLEEFVIFCCCVGFENNLFTPIVLLFLLFYRGVARTFRSIWRHWKHQCQNRSTNRPLSWICIYRLRCCWSHRQSDSRWRAHYQQQESWPEKS